jgi:hypothetical protein
MGICTTWSPKRKMVAEGGFWWLNGGFEVASQVASKWLHCWLLVASMRPRLVG